ncbi:hypothetical protein HK096_004571 [Nowakowskiella sp. JEL0078]|nr:hypothetical protein HK096_004571 [Nowakowskiella sp. JEL0078]
MASKRDDQESPSHVSDMLAQAFRQRRTRFEAVLRRPAYNQLEKLQNLQETINRQYHDRHRPCPQILEPKKDEGPKFWDVVVLIAHTISQYNYFHAGLQALRNVGFEILEYKDIAEIDADVDGDKIAPWYTPLTGKASGNKKTIRDFRMSPAGRSITDAFVSVIEFLRIAPPGTRKVSQLLNLAADQLVAAGKLELFTPMFFFLARKPLTTASAA